MTDENQPSQLPPAGWYHDPMGQGDARYWNGAAWTDSVSRGGVTVQVAVPPEQLGVPPVPGSEFRAPAPPPQPRPAPQPTPHYAAPPPEPREPERRSSGTSILVGLAVAAAVILVVVLLVVAVFDDDGDDPDPFTTTVPAEGTDPTAPTDAPAEDTSGG